MANTLNLGTDGNWAVKKDSLLGYNSENGNFKPLPFEFDRTSSATVVNKDGLIEIVGSGEPRIDFKDNAKGALLLEGTRSNLNTYSDPKDSQKGSTSYASVTYQDNYSWGLGNVINNAIVFVDNSTTRYAYYNSSVTSGTEYTLSVFIKMDDNSIPIPATDFLIVLAGVAFASGYNVESYGNNVYRVSVSGTAGASNTANGILKVASHSTKGFKISAFQVEQGSYPTSYIPTNGTVATFSAETANGANEQVINSTEGVLYLETKGFIDVPSSSEYIQLSKNGEASFNNSLTIQHRNNGYLRIYVNGTATSDIHFNENIDFTENHKIAVLYKLNGYKLFIDGVSQSLFGTPTQTVFSELDNLSFDLRGTLNWNGSIKDVRLYNTALTDSELAILTTI